jgi:regulator of protease activity HflC (stomatin/prohibitin superfamily)
MRKGDNKMMKFLRKVIAQQERGLVLKDKRISKILEPGVHWIFDLRATVMIVDLRHDEIINAHIAALVDSTSEHDALLRDQYFQVIDLGEYEVGLVCQRKALRKILCSGERHIFWRDMSDLSIEIIDTREDFRVEKPLVNVLAKRTDLSGLTSLVYATEVSSKQLGLLWVDGELVDTLSAGLHAFWRSNRSVKVEHMELRLQSLEIAGQEILTKDKVSLRINLSASYQFTDAMRARLQLSDYQDHLYRELQFALREAVGTKSLDALLADKEALNSDLFQSVVKQIAEYGIKVVSVGVKDIILPGEMKEIFNHVVATEKAAQANVIRRREETAATRSLLNTAKLMDENPTLLRLKEIEALEKVVEKVDRLTIYDGLEGLLKDTVKLQV